MSHNYWGIHGTVGGGVRSSFICSQLIRNILWPPQAKICADQCTLFSPWRLWNAFIYNWKNDKKTPHHPWDLFCANGSFAEVILPWSWRLFIHFLKGKNKEVDQELLKQQCNNIFCCLYFLDLWEKFQFGFEL